MEKDINSEVTKEELLRTHCENVLISGALGDAFGMPVEGWRRDQIAKYIGVLDTLSDPQELYRNALARIEIEEDFPHRFTTRALQKGEYTDDTHKTIATGRGIVNAQGLSLEEVAHEHVLMAIRLKKLPKKDNWDSFGRTTTKALQNLENGVSPLESGVLAPQAGNGPPMGMSPVGLYMSATGRYEQGLEFAEKVGRMTHRAYASVVSGVVQAHAVFAMGEGILQSDFMSSIVDVVKRFDANRDKVAPVTLLENLTWVRDHPLASIDDAYDRLGSSFVVTSNYPLTLFMVQKYWDDPLTGLIELVNLGGDTDSTAAMYGNLMGALYGEFTPQDWRGQLRDSEALTQLATELSRIK